MALHYGERLLKYEINKIYKSTKEKQLETYVRLNIN